MSNQFKIKLEVKVIANSSQSKIARDRSKSLKVYLHSPRERGKANEELFDLFKATFKPIKFYVKILSGELQPKKTIEIEFLSIEYYHLFLEKLDLLRN